MSTTSSGYLVGLCSHKPTLQLTIFVSLRRKMLRRTAIVLTFLAVTLFGTALTKEWRIPRPSRHLLDAAKSTGARRADADAGARQEKTSAKFTATLTPVATGKYGWESWQMNVALGTPRKSPWLNQIVLPFLFAHGLAN